MEKFNTRCDTNRDGVDICRRFTPVRFYAVEELAFCKVSEPEKILISTIQIQNKICL